MYIYKLFVIFFLVTEKQCVIFSRTVYKLRTCIFTFLLFFLFKKNISYIFDPLLMKKI